MDTTQKLLSSQKIVHLCKKDHFTSIYRLCNQCLGQLYRDDMKFTEKDVPDKLLQIILGLIDNPDFKHHEIYQLEAFKALIDSLLIYCGDSQKGGHSITDLASFEAAKKLVLRVIQMASTPNFFPDSINYEYFQAISKFSMKDTKIFLSDIGVEFLTSYLLQLGGFTEHTASAKIPQDLRKMLHLQKTRDSIIHF